jgi:hypothetical protein
MIGKIFKYGLVICVASYMTSYCSQKANISREIEKNEHNLEARLEQTNPNLNQENIFYGGFQKYESEFVKKKLDFNSSIAFLNDFFYKESMSCAKKFNYIHNNALLEKRLKKNYLKDSDKIFHTLESYNNEIAFLDEINRKNLNSLEISTEIKDKYESKIEFMLNIISDDIETINEIKDYYKKFPSEKINNFYETNFFNYSKLASKGETLLKTLKNRGE